MDLPAETGVIALPQTAVQSSLYGDFVYVVRPDEERTDSLVARQVFVTPGRRSGDQIEIRSGIVAGDVIVATGQNRLSNGAPVRLATKGDATAQPDTNAGNAQ
jgi:membrane fusion protein (multidrug efflux system)